MELGGDTLQLLWTYSVSDTLSAPNHFCYSEYYRISTVLPKPK